MHTLQMYFKNNLIKVQFTFPWESKEDKVENYVSVGAICTYRVNIDKDDNWSF